MPKNAKNSSLLPIAPSQRLDKWLWFARMAKTRSRAARLVEEGFVRVNGNRMDNPAKTLKSGDVLTISLQNMTAVLKVLAPGERRGPYPEARLLYERLDRPEGDGDPLPELDETN